MRELLFGLLLSFLSVDCLVPSPVSAEPAPDDHWWGGFGTPDRGFNDGVAVLTVFQGELIPSLPTCVRQFPSEGLV